MPVYSNTQVPTSIAPGESAQVWTVADGNLTSGTKTQRLALANLPGGQPEKIAARITFTAAPGVISLQLQTADNDIDAEYASEGSPITAVNASNVARAEFPQIVARFARLLATTVTNATTAVVEFAA